jgi:DNA-binding CsgD family transcriptional regulator
MSAVEAESMVLSERQKQILTMVADGATWKEIIYRLGITRYTLKNHLNSIRERLNTQGTVHAVALAIRRGLI